MATLSDKRTVATFDTEGFVPSPGEPGLLWKNISFDEDRGVGSYLMIFKPGAKSAAHRHDGAEEWYMVDGDLIDHDGHTYQAGEFVSLAAGSSHESVSPSGCKIVVHHQGPFVSINPAELDQAS